MKICHQLLISCINRQRDLILDTICELKISVPLYQNMMIKKKEKKKKQQQAFSFTAH